ncbi:MAG: 30S ribosomal protein S20 [Candidatus Omnitrophica bacterium]|nr:30S ribosomal protein S20 [Candidatus Omnitrophota bacterium]
MIVSLRKGAFTLPQRKSGLKRLRVDKKKHLHNLKLKDDLKKTIKKFQSLIGNKKLEEAKDFFRTLVSKIDKSAAKGIIHKNTAARKKSKFSRQLKGIA